MATINAGDKSWDEKIKPSSVPIPDGEYTCFVLDAFPDVTKTGTQFVELAFQIHDPNSAQKGRILKYQRFWLSDKALPRFIRFLRVVGYLIPFDATDPKEVEKALLDRICKMTVKTSPNEYNGKTTMQTQAVNFRPLTAIEKAVLVDAYGETMLPPLAEEAETSGGDLGEDLPF